MPLTDAFLYGGGMGALGVVLGILLHFLYLRVAPAIKLFRALRVPHKPNTDTDLLKLGQVVTETLRSAQAPAPVHQIDLSQFGVDSPVPPPPPTAHP